jgi:hypothetical protein
VIGAISTENCANLAVKHEERSRGCALGQYRIGYRNRTLKVASCRRLITRERAS